MRRIKTGTYIISIKRAAALVLSFCMALGLLTAVGCGNSSSGNSSGRLSVVCTVFPQYDFVRNIVGDHADVQLLVSPGAEVHGFEPTLEDIADIERSDLFVCISNVTELWVSDALKVTGKPESSVFMLTEEVETLDELDSESMESEDEEGHEHSDEPEMDEHVWTSPRNAVVLTERLCERLCELDVENADEYRSNADAYIENLNRLDRELNEVASSAERKTIVFAERFPFRYLAAHYGLSYDAAFQGCSSDTEPSLATINKLVSKIENEKIPVVFYIEFSTQTVADTIAKATGAKKLQLHSCHNLTREEWESGEDYVSLMELNIEHLEEALN